MINLLHHAKFIASAACVISVIINAPPVSFTPKQIDLQAFLLLQLPYCVSVLLLTSGFILHNTNARYYLVSSQSILTKQIKAKLMLCKPLLSFMAELRLFITYTGVQKQSASARKVAWHMHNEIA